MKLWPGQDGFDFPLQADYRELWRLALEGVQRGRRDGRRHPRGHRVQGQRAAHAHQLLDRRAHAARASQQIGREDIGIVVDLGHSLFAKETPADALHLVNDHGRLFTVEVNDNWREWDDDLPVGSIHLIETLEFFLALRQIGWNEPILLDQFPFREDPVEAARSSIRHDARDRRRARPARPRRAAEAQARQDPLAAQRIVTELLLGGAPVA